jgi:Putative Flp pilus-assembly TadE/G-like
MTPPPTSPTARTQPRRGLRCGCGEDSGRVTAFTVVIVAAVLLFAGLVLDGGLALAAKVRAVGQAQEAARAGAQAIDLTAYRATGTLRLDADRAATLARGYLAEAHTPGAETVTVAGDTVTVTLTVAQPTRLLGLVGVRSIQVTGTGSAHPDRGPTVEGAGP